MPGKRTPRSQSQHDKTVQKREEQLKRQGYPVEADLKGWDQPGTIRGVRPDIDARKGQRRVIVEVETPESKDDGSADRHHLMVRRAAY